LNGSSNLTSENEKRIAVQKMPFMESRRQTMTPINFEGRKFSMSLSEFAPKAGLPHEKTIATSPGWLSG
jgi:hypothetical protein